MQHVDIAKQGKTIHGGYMARTSVFRSEIEVKFRVLIADGCVRATSWCPGVDVHKRGGKWWLLYATPCTTGDRSVRRAYTFDDWFIISEGTRMLDYSQPRSHECEQNADGLPTVRLASAMKYTARLTVNNHLKSLVTSDFQE